MTQQSGKWRGKARSQGGRKPLRDAIYISSSRRGQTQPRYARQIPRHDHKRQTTKGCTDNNHAQTHRARKRIDQRRPIMDAKHRLTKTDTQLSTAARMLLLRCKLNCLSSCDAS
jgi:hypothetical protein